MGAELCRALEHEARRQEIETLYLLTTTAEAFFDAIGYEEVGRETVPPAIRRTREFAELCPDSATCMAKELE